MAGGNGGEAPPLLDTSRAALFLDFDGTLAEIAPDPGAVRVPAALPAALVRLSARLSGALAIISGRPIAEIDHFLAPFTSPASGLHGLERRDAGDGPVAAAVRMPELDAVVARFAASPAAGEGILVEDKGATVAFHFRAAPERGPAVLATVRSIVSELSGVVTVEGKMVIEVKPGGMHKGSAIRAHLSEVPFGARIPVFLGDDVTDEDGFAAVIDEGGVAVKVGPGPTRAPYRLADVAAVHGWLAELADDKRSRNDPHDPDESRLGRD